MSCFENNDTAVTPFVLCSLCRALFELYTNSSSWEALPRISIENSESHFPRFQHHELGTALTASAHSGCHLCSLIDASLHYLGDRARERYDGCLIPLLTRDGPDIQGCSSLQIGIELGANDIESIVRIYRHTNGRTNDKRLQNPCYLRHGGLVEDSLETRAGWSTNTCSSASFVMLRSWLRQCIDDHEICRLSLCSTKPTRVLDLLAFPASDLIRMVETHEVNTDLTYATLSYRWSNTTDFVLTTSNYEDYRSQIPQKSLPRTIREAIEICRSLGVRYLWVDALCVIQGDSDDFMQEVAQMGSIYANSVFTLEASDATDSQCTFSRSRNPLCVEPCVFAGADNDVYWVFDALRLNISWCGNNRHFRTIQDARMSSRGWVFQEQVMAPRTIHFASGEFLWSCREETFCRRCLSRKSPHHTYASKRPEWFGKEVLLTLLRGCQGPERQLTFRRAWGDLIQEFSKTDFTDLDDRLSALAGIAQLIHSNSGFEASYGLRLDFFLDDLRWYSPNNRDPWDLRARFGKLAAYIPSWSWLSFAGPVLFEKIDQPEESIQELSIAQITSYPPATAFRQISVLHSQRLRPPSFRIFGKIHICQLFPWDFSYGQRNWDFIPRAEEQSSALKNHIQKAWDTYENFDTDNFTAPPKDYNLPSLFTYYPDVRSQHRRDVTCLLLRRTWDNAAVSDFGLVLEPVHTGTTTYRRVGSFESRLSDWMYEHWLKKRVRGRLYPNSASNLGDGITSSWACREPGCDISELDGFDDEMRMAVNAISKESGNPGIYTLKRQLRMLSAIGADDANGIASGGTSSSPPTRGTKLDRLASLIKCLRLFNGTEEEAEIEIV